MTACDLSTPTTRLWRMRRGLIGAVLAFALAGCSVPYYTHLAVGQASLLLSRQDVAAVIEGADPARAAALKRVGRMLRFAEGELALPVGGRYSTFVEADGPLVWTVVAAPEFSLTPLEHCYPMVGCAAYRGYFSHRLAERYAARLAPDFDVQVFPAAAYSTLGWFDDPVVSTFLAYDDGDLANLLFHELAHSVLYVPDDTVFNESFAGFVGDEAAAQWLLREGGDVAAYRASLRERSAHAEFLAGWREALAALYRRPIADDAKRALKAELFAAMAADYEARRSGTGRFDADMARPFNNARLALVAAYEDLKPAFKRLHLACGGDWAAFHRAASALAELPPGERTEQLAEPPGAACGRNP